MKITEKEVRYVAGSGEPAALRGGSSAKFQSDLNGILEHMDKLNEIDTTDVEPMAQVLFDAGETATLRADVPVPPFGNEAALANAPQPAPGISKCRKSSNAEPWTFLL